jgi:alkanesulfonate monooxygenase SsuD/methylene tetrahydromethanopterin reductase-like flavin-dependent oxidoreductase (luciferase family)
MHIRLSPRQSGRSIEATAQEYERAEALESDSVWPGEHHS